MFDKNKFHAVAIRSDCYCRLKEYADKEYRPMVKQLELIINKWIEQHDNIERKQASAKQTKGKILKDRS